MGPAWGPPGSCRPQMGPMLVPWIPLSGWLLMPICHQGIRNHDIDDADWTGPCLPRPGISSQCWELIDRKCIYISIISYINSAWLRLLVLFGLYMAFILSMSMLDGSIQTQFPVDMMPQQVTGRWQLGHWVIKNIENDNGKGQGTTSILRLSSHV